MVIIIKRGVLPETVTHNVTCGHCRSELSFTVKEAKRIDDQRDGDFYQIKCPVCGHDVNKQCR